jgi:hypothetical protein
MLTGHAATAELVHTPTESATVASGLLGMIRRLYCGLHGHDNLMHFEKHRMYLQCVSCGHTTPGWSLTEPPPRVVSEEAPQPLARPHLISARRIA